MKGNDSNAAMSTSPLGILIKRQMELCEDHQEKITKALSYFELYANDIKGMDSFSLEEADKALLWMVDVLKEIFLEEKIADPDRLWNLNIFLRNIYRYTLPVKFDTGYYLFPKTKEAMLWIILSQWNIPMCDEHSKEIFLFIWEIYTDERPSEERKTIDAVIMEHIKKANPEDMEKWIMWISTVQENKHLYLHESLKHYFILARARSSSFNRVVQDIRDREIVSALNVGYVADNIFPALRAACETQIELDKEISRCVKYVGMALSLSDGEKITYKLRDADVVEICFVKKKSKIVTVMATCYKTALDDVSNEMTKSGLFEKIRKTVLASRCEITLVLVILDENGSMVHEKHWLIKKDKKSFN